METENPEWGEKTELYVYTTQLDFGTLTFSVYDSFRLLFLSSSDTVTSMTCKHSVSA